MKSKNRLTSKIIKNEINPEYFLTKFGIKVIAKNNKDYFLIICPFHKNGKEKTPSLNMHAITGHYKCHSCGEKGGDVIAFYMAITGKDFKTSTKDLNTWRK